MSQMRRAVRYEEHVALVRKVQSGEAVFQKRATRSENIQEIREDGPGLRAGENDSPENTRGIHGEGAIRRGISAEILFPVRVGPSEKSQ